MRKLWMSVSVEDSQHMIEMLDVNHDDRVSIDEFRRFVYLLPESLVGSTISCLIQSLLCMLHIRSSSDQAFCWAEDLNGDATDRLRPPTLCMLLWTAATGSRVLSSDCA